MLKNTELPKHVPVIIFGGRAFQSIFGHDGDLDAKEFNRLRGTSIWSGGRRYVITYEPWYVTQHPDIFIDFQADVCIPAKFPIVGQPKVAVETQVIGADEEALQTVLMLLEQAAESRIPIAVDVETSGFNALTDDLLCISLATSENVSYVLTPDSWGWYDEIVRDIFRLGAIWVAHNAKFDVRFLEQLLGFRIQISHDTMLMHYVLDERIGTHGLKDLCRQRLGLPDYEKELHQHLKRKADSFATVPKEVLYRYAGQDACYTVRLFHQLAREIAASPFHSQIERAYNFLIHASNVLGKIETHGFIIDVEALRQAEHNLTEQAAELVEKMRKIVGDPTFNPRSPKQVAEYLYDRKGYKEVRLFRNNKPRSTAAEALEKLQEQHPDDEFLNTLLEYRGAQKILSTYITAVGEKVDPDGRLRTDFKLHGTVTGRLSSSTPNLQNIPRSTQDNPSARLIRNLFLPTPGMVLVGADYSQAELRVAAIFAQEETMRDIWASGRDLHTETTIDLFGPNYTAENRMIAKMLNFGVVYGRTANSIAIERNISLAAANLLMRKFFKGKPKLERWLSNIRKEATDKGYLITPVGRIRRFGLITNDNIWRIQNQAANFTIQSTASDCCLLAACKLHEWLEDNPHCGRVLLLVHDSIYAEAAPEHADLVGQKMSEFMQQAAEYILGTDWIPLKADYHTGARWGEL